MVTVQIRTALAVATGSAGAAVRSLGVRGFVLALLTSMLLACVGPGTPVVSDRAVSDRSQQTYTVRRGDTLYSIAWRFDLDHSKLAAANQIRAPFTIFPGQQIRLTEVVARSAQTTKKTAAAAQISPTRTVAGAPSKPSSKPSAKPSSKSGSQRTQPTPPPTSQAKTASTKATVSRPATAKSLPADTKRSAKGWYRPLPQQPSVLFSKDNKGIDYVITSRSRVQSTRSGEVVYAGNGIAGFERLVIIKHSGELLSAYSFNGKMMVSEQQQVGGGSKIAEIMPRPGVRQTLHFEVRRMGKPINPQNLLP